jgi:hypothetical protein
MPTLTASSEANICQATESFIGEVDGVTLNPVRKGDLFRVEDPAVKKWPHFFGPVVLYRPLPEKRGA